MQQIKLNKNKMWYNELMHRRNNKSGFTMVELSLSMVFIAILSIAIVLLIANAVSAYHRGLTLNSINTAGMDIVDDIRDAIKSSTSTSQIISDDGENYVSVVKRANVRIDDETEVEYPVYGAFCTGSYSYIWNSGYYFDGKYTTGAKFAVDGRVIEEDFKLLKVKDNTRNVCKNYYKKMKDGSENIFTIDTMNDDVAYDLLSGSQNDLAIYNLESELPVGNGKNLFYTVSFILGTVRGGINVQSNGGSCAAPEDYNSNFDYCAINQFSFSAQSVGGYSGKATNEEN